jgi:hypothetical protein
VTIFLLVEWLALRVRASGAFHADLTSVISMLLAVTILASEITSERFSVHVLAIVLLSVLAIRPWIGVAEGHRVQPAIHVAFQVIGIVTAAVVVVAAARMAGFTAGQQILALAVTTWLVLAWLVRTPKGSPAGGATAVAFHLIAAGVYASALAVRNGDVLLIAACLITAGAYLVWRAMRGLPTLEHFAAVGAIEAVCLWGLTRHIAWPEYYLLALAAYLCVVLLRQTASRAQNVVAVTAILAAIGYPYIALLRNPQKEHLAFLGIAGIVIIHVLLATRRHILMVVVVCAMLGLGMLFGAAVLHDDVRLNMLMALVGFVVIADLGLIGARSDRRPLVGEIDYDDNRVTR